MLVLFRRLRSFHFEIVITCGKLKSISYPASKFALCDNFRVLRSKYLAGFFAAIVRSRFSLTPPRLVSYSGRCESPGPVSPIGRLVNVLLNRILLLAGNGAEIWCNFYWLPGYPLARHGGTYINTLCDN